MDDVHPCGKPAKRARWPRYAELTGWAACLAGIGFLVWRLAG